MADFRFSKHALDRLVEMDVDVEEIRACLYRPERTYFPPSYPDRENRAAGRLTLALSGDGSTVVTALWCGDSVWRDDLVGRGGAGERKYRDVPSR